MLKSISRVIDNVVAPDLADAPPDNDNKELFDLDAWKYFARYFQGREKKLGAYGLIASAQSLLVLPILYFIKVEFDDAIPNGDILLLVYVGAGVFVIRFLNSGISLWLRRANLKVIKGAIKELRCDLLDVLYKLSRDSHTRMDRNTIHARIVQDTERVDNMSNGLMTSLLPSVFSSLALFVVLIFLNWLLLLVSLLILPLLLFAARLTSQLAKQNVYVFQRSFERFSKGIQFVLKHMDLTKIQSFEREELSRQSEQIDQLRATGEKMAFSYAIMNQVQTTVTGFAGIVILVVGGAAVATGSMTIGELLSFYVAAGLLNGYANSAIRALPSIITGNESLITLRNLAKTDELEPYNGTQQISFDGAVSLAGVSFGYGGQQILDNVNLDISPHAKVAIIGPNGAGKSTILYLILGFYLSGVSTHGTD